MTDPHGSVSQPIGVLAAVTCLGVVIARSGNPLAMKVVLQALPPMQSAFARVAIGCASVGLISVIRGNSLKPRRSEVLPLAMVSLVYGLQISANQTGSDYTSPLLVAILFNTYPITANIVSSFFVAEDRLNLRRVTGLAAAFAGVTWIFLARTESALAPNPLLGNSLGNYIPECRTGGFGLNV